MKNLFDFATKELSQDAFLRWLLENWDDPDIGPISLAFVKMLTGYEFKAEHIDKDNTRTWAQAGDMDVGFDIFTTDGSRYLLVIEDKTDSQEHNQLKEYNKTLEEWQKNDKHKEVYKVYYKTARIDVEERDRVAKAEWKIIPFEEVKEFFKPYVDYQESDVLRDYAQHVLKLWEQGNSEPKGDPKNWSFTEWSSFFHYLIKKKIERIDERNVHIEEWVFQGRLHCFAVYYNYEDGVQPLVEFVARKGSDEVSANVHLTTENEEGKWSWKRCEKSEKLRNVLIKELAEGKLSGFVKTRSRENQQTFARKKDVIKIAKNNPDCAANEIVETTRSFIEFLKSIAISGE